MNPIERGRNLLNQVRTGAEKAIDKVEHAVQNTVDKVHDVAVATGNKVHNAVDGFEQKAVNGAKAVQGFFGGGNQPDKVYDGQFVGAGGKTFPPGTALKDIPGVTPKNNPNPSSTIVYVNDIFGDWTLSRHELVERALEGRHPDLVDPIVPRDHVPFMTKGRHSIFYETQLEYLLRQSDVDRILLTGQVTEQCILYSALDAYVRHFQVGVVTDAVAGAGVISFKLIDIFSSHEILGSIRALQVEGRVPAKTHLCDGPGGIDKNVPRFHPLVSQSANANAR